MTNKLQTLQFLRNFPKHDASTLNGLFQMRFVNTTSF